MDSTYSGSYGRIKVAQTEFLSDSLVRGFIGVTLEDVTRALSSTVYKDDINALYSLYTNPDLLEMAANRRLVTRNKTALFAAPPMTSDLLRAYMSKWDVQNIKSIITSKYLGYDVKETETFLVSFRDVPMGIFGGIMSNDDFRILINQSSIEAVAENLTRFGYGQQLLQHLDNYRKENDIAPMLQGLDRYYYMRLITSLKFFNGDEGPLIRFFKEEVDNKNIMVILAAKDMHVPFEKVRDQLLALGNMSTENLQSLYGSGGVEDIASKLQDRYDLHTAVDAYRKDGDLKLFESEMRSSVLRRYLDVLSSQALSAGSMFAYILRSERERDNLRTIVIGNSYGIEPKRTEEMLFGGA